MMLAGCSPRASDVPFAEGHTASSTTVVESTAKRRAREVTYRVRSSLCGSLVTGSGFAIGPRMIVTNRHVVSGATELTLDSWDGRLIHVAGVAVSEDHDLAVLHTVEQLPSWAKTSGSRVGERVWVIGYPNGGKITVSRGEITSEIEADELQDREEPIEVGKVWQVSAKVQSGDSGGPLINDAGEVVGVVYGFGERTMSGYAVKTDSLEALTKKTGAPLEDGCGVG